MNCIALARSPIDKFRVGATLFIDMDNWKNNSIQFPRLIAELEANGAFTGEVIDSLCESMDLTPSDVIELVDRAQTEWESFKRKTFNH